MARIHHVPTSRKDHTCGKGHVIPKGEPYTWAAPGYRGRKRYRCAAHPFRPSELTTSAASAPMAAVEAFQDDAAAGFDSHEDLVSAWDELRSAVEEYHQEREQALEAWEHGNSQLEEYVDTAQQALDEVEGFTPDEFSDDEPDAESEHWQEWDDARRQHLQEQTDEALSIADGLAF